MKCLTYLADVFVKSLLILLFYVVVCNGSNAMQGMV